MQKYADKYLKLDPWRIIEEGFDSERCNVSESIFSLGNEYMGVRGYFEEGYKQGEFIGSYFNGVYEETKEAAALHYKGIVRDTHFMINSVNWLYTRIYVDDEVLDLSSSEFDEYRRTLDLRTGILNRRFIWKTVSGKHVKLDFERFVSMGSPRYGCQRIAITPLNFYGEVKVVMGLDFDVLQKSSAKKYWTTIERETLEDYIYILGKTSFTEQKVFSASNISSDSIYKSNVIKNEDFIGYELIINGSQGIETKIDKVVFNYVEKTKEIEAAEVIKTASKLVNNFDNICYDKEKEKHIDYWTKVWDKFDITIDGDMDNQQGIRYCIFQMHQTYHGEDPSLNIGAKGLTGEAYNGHTFWDTETYCLPFYIFNNPRAAKNLLEYRYNTLPMAIERAKQLDCEGACYPIATLNGKEACSLWQHASLQMQPSTAVAYGVFHYVKLTDDKEFLYDKGCEMLVQICRYLATRGDWSGQTGEYGYFGVMGPDEFQMMVNNNCYTNYMAKKTFEYTLDVIKDMKNNCPAGLSNLVQKVDLLDDELQAWSNMASKMKITLDKETGIYEQHEGYFNLPHVDINSIPVEEFPLYNNWSYDRIYRNDMIKQPDVLMFMFLFRSEFSEESKKVNYEYYEPRCIHESSLSPSIHSIFASELDKHEEAFSFFNFATRMDLDNYNRNTNEGLHTTSIAAAWVNIVYGFGGLKSDGDKIELNPSIPKVWNSYSFRMLYKGTVVEILVDKTDVRASVIEGTEVTINVYGIDYKIDKKGIELGIPGAARG
ncbi:glycoside hydrolase family 65 protein [Clostridium fungisolvens]|uniref:Maltose phosphorylase n=1 Tax=Clostridium fungisolvens TaxID=1604897 RepID=A0A6V8SP34_9CLOT|nr:glycosyl hydrolase family 65 protein [Clostridium fungisolvens]GFP78456.1 Maltose phosphorylase [Clostridium fungisolvens]